MSLTLIQVKQKLYPHLPSGSSPLLSLEESSLGLDGFKRFLKETIDLETLELKNASLTKGTPANKIEITGTADFLGQVGLAVTFSILETGGKSSLRTSIHFPWPSEKPLPFGNYHLQKPQAEFLWMGKDNDENPILCGLISGNMQLDTLLAPVQIRFPSAPNSIFLKTGFKNPVSLNKGLQQLANIAQAPDLTTLLPNEAVNAIKGLALDQVGILFNTKTNKVNLVSLTVSATGWELVKGGFAIEDLRFSLQVAGIGSGNANITAELDADLVIEKTFRLPLFIRIEPGILSIGKRSTERFQLPGFGAILDALGEEDITDVMPNSFRKAAIAIDTLEIGFNTQAKKLNNVFFQVSMTGVKLEEHFILKYLGLGFRLERQGDSPKPKISGSFMCGLLLGTKNPVELDLHAMLSAGASGNSWQFDARAENINVSGLADIILEVFDADISLPAQLHELVIAELGLSFSKAAQAQNSQSDYKFTLEIKYPKNGQKADVSLTILLTKTDPSTTKPPTGNAQQNVQQPKTSGGYFVAVSGKIKVADKEF
ncbi:MAG: hypothetical protein KDD06_03470, partial [Phaeodactylibacter sp.]|nr:hypothetical protein [Phaeodactylibacter sp.]